MKKLIFLFAFFAAHFIYAQFTGDDVKFFVGEGSQTAYLIVDFKDGTDDRSYAWGFRYNEGENLSFADMLNAIDDAEPNFTHVTSYAGTFLDDIVFNAHSGLAGAPDWWSTWAGETSDGMSMNGGISESLQDGRWFGASYGFSNPGPEHPITPIPAYSSLWFSAEDINTWFGEGENQSIVIVDFGTDTDGTADSFAFGIKYSEESISLTEAMDLLSQKVLSFSYETDGDSLLEISWDEHIGTADGENQWKTYTGTDLSNWVTVSDLNAVELTDGQWLGFSFGERRPFTPTDQAQEMSVSDADFANIQLYPNPASNIFYVNGKDISKVEIYDLAGRLVKSASNISNGISVSEFSKGIYILKIQSGKSVNSKKLIIR